MLAIAAPRSPVQPSVLDALRQRVRERFASGDRMLRGIDIDAPLAMITLMHTAVEVSAAAAAYARGYGLSPGRINVLILLSFNDGQAMRPSDIGRRLVVTRGNVTGLVDGLVEAGLVRREPSTDDRRTQPVRLTAKGTRFMRRFAPEHLGNVRRFAGALTQTERRALVRLLDKVRAHVVPAMLRASNSRASKGRVI